MESGVNNLIKVPGGNVAANALCRLGNQMFIAVASMTYAKRSDRTFFGLVKTDNLNDYPEDIMKSVMRNVKFIDRHLVSDFYKLEHGPWLCNGFPNTEIKNILFDDFFQDNRCIDKDIAYGLFKPYDSIKKTIYEMYGDLSNCVCVNVRRGDYLSVRGLGFNVYSKDELNSIINKFFQNDKILFVSDDINWCKMNFIGDKYMFADKQYKCKPEIDLYIQTQCKANVISNSTFSWWGAYLNDKAEKVICHWPWFHSGKINEMKNILPNNWIKFGF